MTFQTPTDLYLQPTNRYSVYSIGPLELFVPGRVCLFGEHSDWCCQFPAADDPKVDGAALVSAPQMGIYAQCTRIRDGRRLVYFESHLGGDFEREIPLDEETLKASAGKAGNLLGYVEGTISRFLNRYPCNQTTDSVEIINHKTTLPLKKGLSSSASICVLTVRALALSILGKQLSPEEEMDIAYEGERLTPSLCGRLDQICAKLRPGQIARLAFKRTSEGVNIVVEEVITPIEPVYMLIVNLAGTKDTIKILSALRTAAEQNSYGIRHLFGRQNFEIVQKASGIIKGEAEPGALGSLATFAQGLFDERALPACPSELSAPSLHQLLSDPHVQALSTGGKSVGAGGDGTALLFTPSAENQQNLLEYTTKSLHLETWATTL